MKNIYKTFFLLIFAVCIPLDNCFSQTAPGIEWQNSIGGNVGNHFSCMEQTSDGGYILGGWSNSNISGDKTENSNGLDDYWIVKTDGYGNIQWDKTIGGSNYDRLYSIEQTSDGGYILGGYSLSNISGDKTENSNGLNDYWIVKTDDSGNIQWQNTIGGNNEDKLYSIRQTSDGGYILGGFSQSNISGDKTENNWDSIFYSADYWLIKTDTGGIIEWQRTIGGSNIDELNCIRQTPDEGYILGGTSRSGISGDKTENSNGGYDYWLVKTDTSGTIQWQNSIGGTDEDKLYSVHQTNDGGYILGGFSPSNISGDKTENCNGLNDYWIVKTDSLGNIQWQNTIGANNTDQLYSIDQTNDGGYILGGYSQSNISGDKTENSNGGFDYWIVKTNTLGNIQWQNTIGGNEQDLLFTIQQTSDDGYILGGYSMSSISGDKTEDNNGGVDYWIVKLFPDTITGITNLQFSINNLQFFPNPLINQSKLTFKNDNKQKFFFTLYDITGRITESVSTTNYEIILTKGSKQPGVYLFNLVNEKTGERWNGKIVISDQR